MKQRADLAVRCGVRRAACGVWRVESHALSLSDSHSPSIHCVLCMRRCDVLDRHSAAIPANAARYDTISHLVPLG